MTRTMHKQKENDTHVLERFYSATRENENEEQADPEEIQPGANGTQCIKCRTITENQRIITNGNSSTRARDFSLFFATLVDKLISNAEDSGLAHHMLDSAC